MLKCSFMKKNKRRRPSKAPYKRYEKYLLALLEGKETAVGNKVYWDLGPGERPHIVLVDFTYIVRKEKLEIAIKVARGGRSLVFTYPDPGIRNKVIRVRAKDGVIKNEANV